MILGPLVLPFCDHTKMCSKGVAVSEPQDNAGLVTDCALLLESRDSLAGKASLNWKAVVPIGR